MAPLTPGSVGSGSRRTILPWRTDFVNASQLRVRRSHKGARSGQGPTPSWPLPIRFLLVGTARVTDHNASDGNLTQNPLRNFHLNYEATRAPPRIWHRGTPRRAVRLAELPTPPPHVAPGSTALPARLLCHNPGVCAPASESPCQPCTIAVGAAPRPRLRCPSHSAFRRPSSGPEATVRVPHRNASPAEDSLISRNLPRGTLFHDGESRGIRVVQWTQRRHDR